MDYRNIAFVILATLTGLASAAHIPEVKEQTIDGFNPATFNFQEYKKSAQQDPQKFRYKQQQITDNLEQRFPREGKEVEDQSFAQSQEVAVKVPAPSVWKVVHPKFVTENTKETPKKIIKKSLPANSYQVVEQDEIQDRQDSAHNYLFPTEIDLSGKSPKILQQNLGGFVGHHQDVQIQALNSLIGQQPNVQLHGLQQLLGSNGAKDHTPIKEDVEDIPNPQTKPNIKVEHNQEEMIKAIQALAQNSGPGGDPNALKSLQAQLDATANAHAEAIIAQAQQKALEQVKAQHAAIAKAQADAEKSALAQIQAQNVALNRAHGENEARRRAEYENRKFVQESRKQSEYEAELAARQLEIETRKQSQFEARRKAEIESRKRGEFEARRKADREFEARLKDEFEARRKAEIDAKNQGEFEARKKAEIDARNQGEFEARRKAENDARNQARRNEERKQFEFESRRKQEVKRKQQVQNEENRRKQEEIRLIKKKSKFANKNTQEVSETQNHYFTSPVEDVEVLHTPTAYSNYGQAQDDAEVTKYYIPPQITVQEGKNKHGEQELQYAAKYAFGYRIRDFHQGNDFGHAEEKDGHTTKGHYHVLLPDGRMQNVHYYADPTGYHAKVSYGSGEAEEHGR